MTDTIYTCQPCAGRGWVRTDSASAWFKCKYCYGSGNEGTTAPDEILTSDGRVSRGHHVLYMPAKPQPPVLHAVPAQKAPDE